MLTKSHLFALTLAAVAPFGLAACAEGADEAIETAESALGQCVTAAPVVTEVRQEVTGAVAAGVKKAYNVTVRNANSSGCAPVTLSFVPSYYHLWNISANPSSLAGVASNATATFRVEVTSDSSMPNGSYNLAFTAISLLDGKSVQGSLPYVINNENPTGCYRQIPQVSVQADSTPVAAGTTKTYKVTVSNSDNAACGTDVFSVIPDYYHLFSYSSSSAMPITAGSSATFTVTAASIPEATPGIYDLGFTVVGNRHGSMTKRGSVRYQIR